MKSIKAKVLAFLLVTGMPLSDLLAQSQSDDLFEMSLNDLMDIEIVSASKKSENVFDTPVSSYSITRSEIINSGVTSIPEALRLCPGVVVRETTNGNYDIHLRGFDNLPRYTMPFDQMNLITLVMIDNRPVFNYNMGGTNWESLPIDIVDVERIEVVKGPTSPLFGPNAVSGVINIITKKAKNQGLYTSANAQLDQLGSTLGSIAIGNKFNEKFSVIASANFQDRKRHDDLYYFYAEDQFVENVSGANNAEEAYPDTESSLEKFGANAFISYEATEDAGVNLSLGLQDARVQRPYLPEEAALSFNSNNSKYVNLNAYYLGLNARVSYNNGYDNLRLGSFSSNGTTISTEYDFDVTDIMLDYQWMVSKKLSLRPGFNYQNATYDDSQYANQSPSGGFLNDKRTVTSTGGSFRVDYFPIENLRLISAIRADKFNVPDKLYTSYQFASTYKIADKFLLRASHAKSNSGAFVANTSLNINLSTDLAFDGPGSGPFVISQSHGNEDIKLTTITATEIGFRGQIREHFQLDLELFYQEIDNISMIVKNNTTYEPTGLEPPYPPVIPVLIENRYENLPLTGIQNGLTLSANYVANSKLQLKPFITVQHTEVKNLPRATNNMPLDPVTNPGNLSITDDLDHESTPSVYGGGFINFAASKRLNTNVSAYFFGKHTQYTSLDNDPNRNTTVREIDGKMLLNAKVSYVLIDHLKLYLSGRNLLNQDGREFYGTDRISATYYAGLSYNF
ncbi:TonB-dependent receptor [Porifericola rhodea]|uniref:TonB-dependent receptor plug domain-containing protein n=1 Tax=Porifericola rhodea TaxID=930972 RepID=UPI002665173C|nr:TonB-dependent receptor plug domain-containing protein [Porifericola rhodea]WKN30899.1 TonB-dependent receptor [Porifericola rhodea]